MTPVANNLPLTFRNHRGLTSHSNQTCATGLPHSGVPRHGGSDAVGNVAAVVAKFNAAFREQLDCEITIYDRDTLATMKRYAHLMRRDDIADEIEYHLARPMDGDISRVVTLTPSGEQDGTYANSGGKTADTLAGDIVHQLPSLKKEGVSL